MFVLAITHEPLAPPPSGLAVDQISVGRWTVTAGVDGWLARCVKADGSIEVFESPVADAGRAAEVKLSHVRVDGHAARATLCKPALSGRPIYYHVNGRGELYCATHVALLRALGVPIAEATELVPEFFAYRAITPPRTLFRDIRQMQPDTKIEVELADGSCRAGSPTVMGFPASAEPGRAVSMTEARDRTLAGLNDSLAAFAGEPERLAVLLSGGLDSSILYRLCADHHGLGESYSAAFEFEPRGTERRYATTAAEAMGSDHHTHTIPAADYMLSTLHAFDEAEEPLIVEHSGAFSSLFRDGLPGERQVIIQGQGADCFFGLKHHRLLLLQNKHWNLWRALSVPGVYHLLRGLSSRTGRFPLIVEMVNRSRAGKMPLEDPRHLFWTLDSYGDVGWVREYFNVTAEQLIANRLEALEPYRGLSVYDLITVMDLISDVAPLQNLWSKIGERHGRVLYYAFSHDPVLRAAAALDWASKIAEPKAILRNIARQIGVPDFIFTRAKSGFGLAQRDWAVPGGLFQPLVDLAAKAFDPEQIRAHQSLDLAKRGTFWNMINYAIWKRRMIDNESMPALEGELREAIERNNRESPQPAASTAG